MSDDHSKPTDEFQNVAMDEILKFMIEENRKKVHEDAALRTLELTHEMHVQALKLVI